MPGESLNFDIVNQRTCGSIITQWWKIAEKIRSKDETFFGSFDTECQLELGKA